MGLYENLLFNKNIRGYIIINSSKPIIYRKKPPYRIAEISTLLQ